MSWIYLLDLFGTCVFAISGVITAIEKKFDLVGALIIGFITAIGGGTIRDMMIGRFPVGWLNDRNYIYAIIIGFIISHLFYNAVRRFKISMFLFDTIGIGLFTILGIQVALKYGLRPEICIIMGIISATFGGVLRDVLTNEIPLIFRKEIYATACFIGALVYFIMLQLSSIETLNILSSMFVVMLIRYLSIKNKWSLNFQNNN